MKRYVYPACCGKKRDKAECVIVGARYVCQDGKGCKKVAVDEQGKARPKVAFVNQKGSLERMTPTDAVRFADRLRQRLLANNPMPPPQRPAGGDDDIPF